MNLLPALVTSLLLAGPTTAAQDTPVPALALTSSVSGTGLSDAMRAALPPLGFLAPQAASGVCPERGPFALVIVPVEESDERGQATARLRAQAELASFLESDVTSESSREIEAEGAEVRSHFSNSARSSSAAVVNGLVLSDVQRAEESGESQIFLIYAVSERSVALSARLEGAAQRAWSAKATGEARTIDASSATAADLEGVRIFAMGFALVIEGAEDAAFEAAMTNARAQAVEQTRGALLISRASWSMIEGESDADAEAFSFAAGQLDRVELLHSTRVEDSDLVVVHIAATVQPMDYGRCLEAYVRAFGSPRFAVVAGEDGTVDGSLRAVSSTLVDLGLEVVRNVEDAEYLVEVSSRFEPSTHPLRKTPVTTLVPALRVVSRADDSVVAEPEFTRALGSNLSDARHRERECVEAFRRALRPALEEDLGATAERHMRFGRRLRVRLAVAAESDEVHARLRRALEPLPRSLKAVAGVSEVRWDWERDGSELVLDVTTLLRNEDVEVALMGLIGAANGSIKASVERSTATELRVRAQGPGR